jgi:hypothetical protein
LRKNAEGDPVKLMEIEARIVAIDVASQERELHEMLLLLDKHNIPRDLPEKWFYLAQILALKLARVSGESRPKGRPKGQPKWDDRGKANLIAHVVLYRHAMAVKKGCDLKKIPIIRACELMIECNPEVWVTKKGGKVTAAASLQKRYNEAGRSPSVKKLAKEIFLSRIKEWRRARPTDK